MKLDIKYISGDAYIIGGPYNFRLVDDLPWHYIQSLYKRKSISTELIEYLEMNREKFYEMQCDRNYMAAVKSAK